MSIDCSKDEKGIIFMTSQNSLLSLGNLKILTMFKFYDKLFILRSDIVLECIKFKNGRIYGSAL